MADTVVSGKELEAFVRQTVQKTMITDMHTHLYAPEFGSLLLWGIDELLTYHYLVAETLRWTEVDSPYEQFWSLSKSQQAEYIWRKLFLEHSPLSEAASGVLQVLHTMGLDVGSRDLNEYRKQWASRTPQQQIDAVFQLAGIRDVVMTNDPFDPNERELWLDGRGKEDPRFHAALRVDPLLNNWDTAVPELHRMGYQVEAAWTDQTIKETQRFLRDWVQRMDALYMAVSMPGDFRYPIEDHRARMIDEVMIPACQELGIPFALMIGVRRQVNPELRLAGDMSMLSDVSSVEALCRKYPQQKFLVTMLARENQHELAVLARKFRNLMVFGCWWFLNIGSIVKEMTAFRVELLGTSMIPQHSDARILEQLIYKWGHSREIIASVLTEKYSRLQRVGWTASREEIKRDVEDLLGNNFWRFVGKTIPGN
ncbi:glucuronate isomerase [Xylanibacillus composti]|uniref:Glucuronate isomerase n=1 Tax=Xylanibacillus composti TaxID=1572762 RepID=A0A8J4H0V8_9BACL|nr:glucuronate isomerase [Xylanibacillus composti]MDT9726022.1 glucuronate isomerase [Xylanibacillus composti]GIQ68834.1 glucuronate isomerase [Xylanibacillus composti]